MQTAFRSEHDYGYYCMPHRYCNDTERKNKVMLLSITEQPKDCVHTGRHLWAHKSKLEHMGYGLFQGTRSYTWCEVCRIRWWNE